MEAEKEKHQKKEMKAKKGKNRNKSKADRAPKSEDHRKERIEWPKANSPEWQRLDHDISELLKTLYSSPEKKAISHPKIIYAMSKERFGVKQKKEQAAKSTNGPSRRQKKCSKLRKEIKTLKKSC